MQGYLALVLHAHLPFVRHPEHERFLEENWLFEAVVETYLPLLQVLEGWQRDGLQPRLTLSLSPTLCAMLRDPLLQDRCMRHLDGLVELAEREIHRTHWDKALQPLAWLYHERFVALRRSYFACGRDLVAAFARFQEAGLLEIITTAATHAVLPLLAQHPSSIRAQILVARDSHRRCFGRDPEGIWLPECAYTDGVEQYLQEAGIRWLVTDTHGILHARPRPRYGVFAPIFTPNGIAAFGRDLDSAQQVWSKDAGYPGDPRYRDFYRDIGFDLDFDYVKPLMPVAHARTFTGIKYHAITGAGDRKNVYDRDAALAAAADHAAHFLEARSRQFEQLHGVMDRPALLLSPYDAELLGHWWYEGPEFLDSFVRRALAGSQSFRLATPSQYLKENPTQQIAQPSLSSWGEEGYLKVWLNERNEWILPHLDVAMERMTQLARMFPFATGTTARALQQAARELLLAQSSDWPFILRTGTSPAYARKRVTDHILRFISLYEMIVKGQLDEAWLSRVESMDNLFPDLDYHYWA